MMNTRIIGMFFKLTVAATLLLATVPGITLYASAQSTSFSFNLITPNVSLATATVAGTPVAAGDTLRLTGSGTFDTSSQVASGGGSFTHFRPDGTVFARGTWIVTNFVSFNSYGGPSPGIQGGLLTAKITIVGPEATFTGIAMHVSCRVNAPQGAPDEGTTLPALFSNTVSGLTLFHASD